MEPSTDSSSSVTIAREDVSATKKKISVEVAAAEVSRIEKEVLKGYRNDARIPGFREGKAPLDMIRKRLGDSLEKEVRERVMNDSFRTAMEQEDLQPVANPEVDNVQDAEDGGLKYEATVEVLPEFEIDGYKGLDVTRPKVEVEEEQVEKFLGELRESRGQWHTVDGRASKVGDLVHCELVGKSDDGEPVGEDGEPQRVAIEVGATDNLPVFNEKLEGVSSGDEIGFNVDYPAEYPAEQLAGKSVHYDAKIGEIKEKEVPELDDEFAKDLGDFENLDELKADIRKRLEGAKAGEVDQTVKQALIDQVLLANPIVLPEVLVDEEVRFRLEDVAHRMVQQGVDPEKADFDWAKFREQQMDGAKKSVHARLLLDAIAEKESVEVEPEELQRRLVIEARRAGRPPEELAEQLQESGRLQVFYNQIVREKALDLVEAVANIQDEE